MWIDNILINRIKIVTFFVASSFLFIRAAGAQEAVTDFDSLVENIVATLNPIVVLLIGIAVATFFWGIIKYIAQGDKEKKRKEGSRMMLYGVIAIFVMISIWGFVSILQGVVFGGPPTEFDPEDIFDVPG